ncbi:VOC family protein [Corynebacterium sp. TA-R-1]|uniref:VOC family protein n=1 Tax=Corynebacterium stercoris TaxID=2943490 RepID=A0ABT1G279_9CORY|nr:VOC family protein [Corynebacterium stercoris]MCP1388137.1 VOC family protein [Corynebacterium stercoris]
MPAFEALEGMPFWQELVTEQPQKSTYFLSRVFGWEIGTEGADNYRLARKDGLPVAGVLPLPSGSSAWVVYFFARGDHSARVEELGGTVLGTGETPMGAMMLCRDIAGGVFGIIEPAGEESFVAAGEPGVPVWYEYVAPSTAAIDFYGDLFDWTIHREGSYFTAEIDGAAFLGLSLIDEAPTGIWQTFFGVEHLTSAATQVVEYGGTLIEGPVDSPFGPLAVVEDPTGAGFFLCEVEKPEFEELSEADSILDLDLGD